MLHIVISVKKHSFFSLGRYATKDATVKNHFPPVALQSHIGGIIARGFMSTQASCGLPAHPGVEQTEESQQKCLHVDGHLQPGVVYR